MLAQRLAAAGHLLPPWQLRDLRRSADTRMGDIGVPPHIVEQILNHVSGHKAGVAGTYNRSTYEREVRAAMLLWGEHIEAIVRGPARCAHRTAASAQPGVAGNPHAFRSALGPCYS
jgi:hypothetical protein